jgi:hypothetical protein
MEPEKLIMERKMLIAIEERAERLALELGEVVPGLKVDNARMRSRHEALAQRIG